MFYLAIPLGFALGYLIGGSLSHHWGWRNAFLVTGGPGVVLALSCLWIEEPTRKLADAKGQADRWAARDRRDPAVPPCGLREGHGDRCAARRGAAGRPSSAAGSVT